MDRWHQGFGLIAVLVGLLVASLAFVSVMKVVQLSQAAQGQNEMRSEFDSQRSSIQRVLESSNLCGSAFRNADNQPLVMGMVLKPHQPPSVAVPVYGQSNSHILISSIVHAGAPLFSFPTDVSPRTRLNNLKIVEMIDDGEFIKDGNTFKKFVSKIQLNGESGITSRRPMKYEYIVPLVMDATTNEIVGCRINAPVPRTLQGTTTCTTTFGVCNNTIQFDPPFEEVPRVIVNISRFHYNNKCRANSSKIQVKVTSVTTEQVRFEAQEGGDLSAGCGGFVAEEIAWTAIGVGTDETQLTAIANHPPAESSVVPTPVLDVFDMNPANQIGTANTPTNPANPQGSTPPPTSGGYPQDPNNSNGEESQ